MNGSADTRVAGNVRINKLEYRMPDASELTFGSRVWNLEFLLRVVVAVVSGSASPQNSK